MCWIGEDEHCGGNKYAVECKECAKDKYIGSDCGHKWVWFCKDAAPDTNVCPLCQYWTNAFGKMGY